MVQKIDTYQDFLREIVEPDFNDFFEDKSNLRRAWQCAGSLFHLHDWVYAAHKTSIDVKYTFTNRKGATENVSCNQHFANALGQLYPNFELVRGIANASKHFALRTPKPGTQIPPGMPSHAANTYVTGTTFQPGAFAANAFPVGSVVLEAQPDDIEFSRLAQSVLDMWKQLFAQEGYNNYYP
jgi:hypothetical protein